ARAGAAGDRQAPQRHPRGEQVLRVRSLLGQLHDACARRARRRGRRRPARDGRAHRRPHVSRPRARRLLRHAPAAARQRHRDAAATYWKIPPTVVYERKGPPPLQDGPSGRVLFALVILLLTAPAWATRLWGRLQRTGLAVAVVPYVLLGSVFWFLAIISPLPY